MSYIVKVRRGTTSAWAVSQVVLAPAELGLDITLNKLKVGNGVDLWPSLPYINVLPSELAELSQDYVNQSLVGGNGITKVYDDVSNTITLSVDTSVIASLSSLSSHESDTTNIHGIVDTANLATKSYADSSASAAVSSHESDTTNIHGIADTSLLATKSYADSAAAAAAAALVDSAPGALDTLNELAAAINDDASFASTITTALGTKLNIADASSTYAPINNPTFTGTVSGVTKTMVGLGNVDNTSDINKPISTAVAAALSTIDDTLLTKSNNLTSKLVISDTTHIISGTNLYKRLEFTASSAVTVSIPSDGTENLPVGSSVELLQAGTGKITVQGEDLTVSIYGPDNQFKSRVQWSSIFLEKRDANSWLVTGDTEA